MNPVQLFVLALIAFGTILLFPMLAVLLGTYLWQIATEEAMLAERVGPSYAAHRQRTWWLFPSLFSVVILAGPGFNSARAGQPPQLRQLPGLTIGEANKRVPSVPAEALR